MCGGVAYRFFFVQEVQRLEEYYAAELAPDKTLPSYNLAQRAGIEKLQKAGPLRIFDTLAGGTVFGWDKAMRLSHNMAMQKLIMLKEDAEFKERCQLEMLKDFKKKK